MAKQSIPKQMLSTPASGPILFTGLQALGKRGLSFTRGFGAAAIFFARAVISVFRPRQLNGIIAQIYYIGAKSTGIVALVAIFTGMVLGLQLYYTLAKFGSVGVLGSAISLTLIRELGPVLTAIMITARAGSAMTAEIGIQRISEQIDALTTMQIDPLGFLISPRIVAALISFPLLTALFDIIGIFGGYLTGVLLMDGDPGAIPVPCSIERGDGGHQRRIYQIHGFCRHRVHHLLLPGVLHPHA